MNLRDAIASANPVVIKEPLKHDEVVPFLRKKGLGDRPVVLNVEGKKVAKNLVSSRELLGKYLGVGPYDIARTLAETEKKEGGIEVVDFSEMDVVRKEVNLYNLPILKYYPQDGGRYITAGVVIARRENFNASIHRMMVLDERSVAIRLVAPRHT